MFVRAKTIKGKKYAYLVENIWKNKKVSQKVKDYLGNIVELSDELIKEPNSVENYDWNQPLKLLFREIICDQFVSRGFIRKKWILKKDNLTINLSTNKIKKDDQEIVLFLNGRYLYGKLLNQIQNFYDVEEEDTPGQKLAKLFSDAGISISKDVFVMLYKKIYINK